MMLFIDSPIAWFRFEKYVMIGYLQIEQIMSFHVDERGIIDRSPNYNLYNIHESFRRENVTFIVTLLNIKIKDNKYGRLSDKYINSNRKEIVDFFSKLCNQI